MNREELLKVFTRWVDSNHVDKAPYQLTFTDNEFSFIVGAFKE